jgi:hypothetical protein
MLPSPMCDLGPCLLCAILTDYKSHVVVMERSLVVRHYACTWFVPDLISSFPYEWLPDHWPSLLVMLKVSCWQPKLAGHHQQGGGTVVYCCLLWPALYIVCQAADESSSAGLLTMFPCCTPDALSALPLCTTPMHHPSYWPSIVCTNHPLQLTRLGKLLRMLRLAKLLMLVRTSRPMRRLQRRLTPTVLRLVSLAFAGACLAHYVACVFYYIAAEHHNQEDTWLSIRGLRDAPR